MSVEGNGNVVSLSRYSHDGELCRFKNRFSVMADPDRLSGSSDDLGGAGFGNDHRLILSKT